MAKLDSNYGEFEDVLIEHLKENKKMYENELVREVMGYFREDAYLKKSYPVATVEILKVDDVNNKYNIEFKIQALNVIDSSLVAEHAFNVRFLSVKSYVDAFEDSGFDGDGHLVNIKLANKWISSWLNIEIANNVRKGWNKEEEIV